jgi:hypothetical protein
VPISFGAHQISEVSRHRARTERTESGAGFKTRLCNDKCRGGNVFAKKKDALRDT